MGIRLLLAGILVALHVTCTCGQQYELNSVSIHFDAAERIEIGNLAEALNLNDSYSFTPRGEVTRTAKGNGRQRVQLMFNGLRLFWSFLSVPISDCGFIVGTVVGEIYTAIEDVIGDVSFCSSTSERLMQKAMLPLQGQEDRPRRNIREDKIIFVNDSIATVAYTLEFVMDGDSVSRPFFIFDACDPGLRTLMYFDKLQNHTSSVSHGRPYTSYRRTRNHRGYYRHTGNDNGHRLRKRPSRCQSLKDTEGDLVRPPKAMSGNEKVGKLSYGVKEPLCLKPAVTGNTCVMDTEYVKVVDMMNARKPPLDAAAVEFPCDEGYMDAINGGFGPSNDAFFAATESCRMYKEWYGVKCLPSQPLLFVHYRTCTDNAFWDGTAMLIGDGCNFFYPLTDVDVVAHELAHGVTDFNSDLIYYAQSGGMNEHFSDFAAEAVQNFVYGSNDWLIGPDIVQQDRPLRYMEMPSKDGRSIDSASDYTPFLARFVHRTSGVYNRAMWQLVNVQRLPIRQAFEISLHANRAYWKPNSNFRNGACDFMKAAYDLGYNVTKVHGAFDVVDINLDFCDFQAVGMTTTLGESYQNIWVSQLRNPIFKLDIPDGISRVEVFVTPKDYYDRTQIKVSITSDSAGANSVTTGIAPFHFRVTDQTNFIKFSAYVDEDVSIQFTLKEYEAKPYYRH